MIFFWVVYASPDDTPVKTVSTDNGGAEGCWFSQKWEFGTKLWEKWLDGDEQEPPKLGIWIK